MELLFFGGRHRYPGETVSWGEYFGEWLEHPILLVLVIGVIVFWVFMLRANLKLRKEEREEQERQKELYGDMPLEQKKEKQPSYEDIYLDIQPSRRVPDGELPFGDRNKTIPKYEWRFFIIFLTFGFIIGMGGSVGGMNDVLMLFIAAVLVSVVTAARHLPAYLVYEEEQGRKRIDWTGLGKELLPYGIAFMIGVLLGFLQQWLI